MRLTNREKTLAGCLAAVAACWLVYTLAVAPARQRIETLRRVIPQRRQELEQFRLKSSEYATLRQAYDELQSTIDSQDESFELASYLESLVQQNNLADKTTMQQYFAQPRADVLETIVEIRLERAALPEIISLISQVEQSHVAAQVKTIHVQRHPADAQLLDARIEIHTVEPSSETVTANL